MMTMIMIAVTHFKFIIIRIDSHQIAAQPETAAADARTAWACSSGGPPAGRTLTEAAVEIVISQDAATVTRTGARASEHE